MVGKGIVGKGGACSIAETRERVMHAARSSAGQSACRKRKLATWPNQKVVLMMYFFEGMILRYAALERHVLRRICTVPFSLSSIQSGFVAQW